MVIQVQANKQDRMLTISGERSAPAVPEEEKDMRRRRERRFGKFRRTFQVCGPPAFTHNHLCVGMRQCASQRHTPRVHECNYCLPEDSIIVVD